MLFQTEIYFSSGKNLGSHCYSVLAIQLAAKRGTLEPDANVKILSLGLACGCFSLIMLLVGAFYVICYEEKKPKVKAVLYKRIKTANIAYSPV